MMIVLDDITAKEQLYPFSYTRSIADIRIGILTIREKWEIITSQKIYTISEVDRKYLEDDKQIYQANIVPSREWVNAVSQNKNYASSEKATPSLIRHPWQLVQTNEQAIRDDFKLISNGKISCKISDTNKTIADENIFIEDGAIIEHSILNASEGPVFIGKNARVMEGCMIRGPVALCEGSVLKMGTKVYGSTTIGPYCIAGGEIKNSILFGYTNKAHDGYLGDSVIGEWCNLGAGTSNSNIKNTAGVVKVWNNAAQEYINAGLKCGLIMGDYSMCSINTSFNTGTVAGICCNIFGNAFPPKYIPDFSWGNECYQLDKALQNIDNWKKLKGKSITEKEIKLLSSIYLSQKTYNA